MQSELSKLFNDAGVKNGQQAIMNAQDIEFETRIAREGLSTTKAERRELKKFSRRSHKVAKYAKKQRKKWARLERRYG